MRKYGLKPALRTAAEAPTRSASTRQTAHQLPRQSGIHRLVRVAAALERRADDEAVGVGEEFRDIRGRDPTADEDRCLAARGGAHLAGVGRVGGLAGAPAANDQTVGKSA